MTMITVQCQIHLFKGAIKWILCSTLKDLLGANCYLQGVKVGVDNFYGVDIIRYLMQAAYILKTQLRY